jgi:hypothetical protein
MVLKQKNLSFFGGLTASIEREEFISKTDHSYLLGREILPNEMVQDLEKTMEGTHTEIETQADELDFEIRHWVIEVAKKTEGQNPGRIFLGRSVANDIYIPHPTISSEHAYFTRDLFIVNRWFLVDRGSANGTRVNGLGVAPRSRNALLDGDTICFGQCAFQWLTPSSFYDRLVAFEEDVQQEERYLD